MCFSFTRFIDIDTICETKYNIMMFAAKAIKQQQQEQEQQKREK